MSTTRVPRQPRHLAGPSRRVRPCIPRPIVLRDQLFSVEHRWAAGIAIGDRLAVDRHGGGRIVRAGGGGGLRIERCRFTATEMAGGGTTCTCLAPPRRPGRRGAPPAGDLPHQLPLTRAHRADRRHTEALPAPDPADHAAALPRREGLPHHLRAAPAAARTLRGVRGLRHRAVGRVSAGRPVAQSADTRRAVTRSCVMFARSFSSTASSLAAVGVGGQRLERAGQNLLAGGQDPRDRAAPACRQLQMGLAGVGRAAPWRVSSPGARRDARRPGPPRAGRSRAPRRGRPAAAPVREATEGDQRGRLGAAEPGCVGHRAIDRPADGRREGAREISTRIHASLMHQPPSGAYLAQVRAGGWASGPSLCRAIRATRGCRGAPSMAGRVWCNRPPRRAPRTSLHMPAALVRCDE